MKLEAVTIFDSHPDGFVDARIKQLCALVRELSGERVQAGLDCLKVGDDRAGGFFQDGIDAEKHLKELLEDLGYDSTEQVKKDVAEVTEGQILSSDYNKILKMTKSVMARAMHASPLVLCDLRKYDYNGKTFVAPICHLVWHARCS